MTVSCSFGNSEPQLSDSSRTNFQVDELIIVGAEKTGAYLSLISDKEIGVVGNQSSRINQVHLVDSLLSLGINIKKVFSPEHGFRGDADAGEHVLNQTDEKTGLPIVSLYGKNKKPTKDQLKDIELLIFDIQDVGVRFYTYISTLHYVMEACAENEIPLLLLDRPNPNGHYVDGPVLEPKYKSFVGMHQVPVVHGMTIGEYAAMINGEGWLKNNLTCNLTVISCDNYSHDKSYSLPLAPSPNLRSDVSIQLYPSLCFFEASTVSVGRGTDGPFERYGHPNFKNASFVFTPKSGPGSKNPKHKGQKCYGFDLRLKEYERMHHLDLSFLLEAQKLLEGSKFIDRPDFFNLLAGNGQLLNQLKEGVSEADIRASWQPKLEAYKELRKKYLLYE